jgi:hypothetical protein
LYELVFFDLAPNFYRDQKKIANAPVRAALALAGVKPKYKKSKTKLPYGF